MRNKNKMAVYIDGRVIVNGESAGFVNIQNPTDIATLIFKAFDQNTTYATLVANQLLTLAGAQQPAYGYGSSENRPANPVNGEMYFDTNLGLPIWYSGIEWVDATGTAA